MRNFEFNEPVALRLVAYALQFLLAPVGSPSHWTPANISGSFGFVMAAIAEWLIGRALAATEKDFL